MKKLKTIHKQNIAQEIALPGAFFLALVFLMVSGASYFNHMNRMQTLDLTRQAVKRAAVQCYAIEGSYPADIAYLEENYGVKLDHDKFFVDYMSLASNIMPNIEVYEKY